VNGCFKGIFRLGCLAAVAVLLAVAWWFRAPIEQKAGSWLHRHPTVLPAIADSVGAPTPGALKSAQEKLALLGARNGSDSVVLSPNEMASLVGSGIDWKVRKTFDSLRVELAEGSFAVACRLDTRTVPKDALGPFQGALNDHEPLRIAGPLTIARPGEARWTITEFSLRGFAFPQPAVTQLAQRAAGADSHGAIPVAIPPQVADVAVHPTGVVLYRKLRP